MSYLLEIITAFVKIHRTKIKEVMCVCIYVESEKQTLPSGNYEEYHIYSLEV